MGSKKDKLTVFFPGNDLAPILSLDHGLSIIVDQSLGDVKLTLLVQSKKQQLENDSQITSNF